MAKEVVYKDDLTGEEIDRDLVGGNPTIVFEFDGERFAIDAGLKTRDALRKALTKYIDAGRKPTVEEDPIQGLLGGKRNPARGAVKTAGAASTGSGRSPEELQAIRDWARSQPEFKDRNISDRGRVAADIVAAFEAANP